jgi:hypothetical protein
LAIKPPLVSSSLGWRNKLKIATLFEKRSRKGLWIYIPFALVYAFLSLWYAEEIGFHQGIPMWRMWPLTIPLILIIFQIIYPTLIVWFLIAAPFALYTCVGIYFFVKRTFGAQWEYDPSGYIMGFVFILTMALICLGLYKKRPTKEINPS